MTIRKTKPKKLKSFYRNMMIEPKVETQDPQPARARQKRKRDPSTTSENNSSEDEVDTETVTKAFKKRRGHPHRSTNREDKTENNEEFLMSGAIPNDEVIYRLVDDDDDFIRSRAPSPSSIGTEVHSRVDSVATAAPKERGAFFST